jgi:cob(I)alamin adenosyltransferase
MLDHRCGGRAVETDMTGSKIVQVYYGDGQGKTTAAVGQSIRAASKGLRTIIIQFLKGCDTEEFSYIQKLEPDIRLFRFEKSEVCYSDLSEEEQEEERKNIINGFNFARKVLNAGECDMLVLDEVLGLVDLGIITVSDIINLIDMKEDYYKLVLTGMHMPEELVEYADLISLVEQQKGLK